MTPITGATRWMAIIADPVEQARTPAWMNELIEKKALDCVLIPLHVKPSDLKITIQALKVIQNFCGAVVSMPFKNAVVSMLDVMTAEVHWTGACNVIRRNRDGSLAGTLLDGEGFVAGLAENQFELRDKRVLLLGAGGAASGIAFALAKYGVQSLHIRNRTASKAELLVKKLKLRFPSVNLQSGPYQEKDFDLVINATRLGMYDDDPLPLAEKFLQPHMLVADVVVSQEMTPLLECAQQKGCHIHGGKWMLETQLEQMLAFMLDQ